MRIASSHERLRPLPANLGQKTLHFALAVEVKPEALLPDLQGKIAHSILLFHTQVISCASSTALRTTG